MNAILIARVSTEEQKDAGNSLPAQLARLEKYCAAKDFTIIKTCSFDESAYKTQRLEFDQIIDFIITQKDKIVVCCDKVDRISRNIFDKRISVLYEQALSDKIELHFVSDGQVINSKISAVEKFQFGISLGLAKYYSDAISDNVKRAQEQKIRKGEWLSKAPFGYKHILLENGKNDIILDEYESHIIVKIFELYATGLYSLKSLIAKIKADYNLVWSISRLDKILNNRFYYGIMVIKGKQYPHRYPTVLTKALFDKVKTIKTGNSKKRSKQAVKRPYIYRGLMRCTDCSLTITPEIHKGFVYYHCTQAKGKHGAKWLREEVITEQIAEIFKAMQLPQDIATQAIETLEQVHKNKIQFHGIESDRLTTEHKSLTKAMDNLYVDKLKGRITDSEYDRFYQSFKEQLDDVNSRLAVLECADDNYFVTTKKILQLVTRVYDLFMSSEVEEKRHLINLVLLNLEIQGDKVLCDAHKPFDLILKSSDHQVWRPQGDSNPCFRRERAVSWTRLDDGDVNGEPRWNRTNDPQLKRLLLYRLS